MAGIPSLPIETISFTFPQGLILTFPKPSQMISDLTTLGETYKVIEAVYTHLWLCKCRILIVICWFSFLNDIPVVISENTMAMEFNCFFALMEAND